MTKSKTAHANAPLPSSALRKLRALGHDLSAVVAIGKDGLTDAIVNATDAALTTHELIKVKVHREAPVDRHEAAADLAKKTRATMAQIVGRMFLLYRRHPKKPKIDLTEKHKKPVKPAKPRHDVDTSALPAGHDHDESDESGDN